MYIDIHVYLIRVLKTINESIMESYNITIVYKSIARNLKLKIADYIKYYIILSMMGKRDNFKINNIINIQKLL